MRRRTSCASHAETVREYALEQLDAGGEHR